MSYIAKIIGLYPSTIYDRINTMRKRGIEIPEESLDKINKLIKKGLDEQKTPTEIAKEIGVSRTIISSRISQMRERGFDIPKVRNKTSNQFIEDIEIEDKNKKIIEGLENRLTQAEIARNIGLSRQAVNQRIKKLDEGIKKRLGIMIVNLMTTKNATIEQIKIIGEYYGVDVEEVLNSLDEQER